MQAELRQVFIVHEDRADWIARQCTTAISSQGIREMAYFLFGPEDIKVVADDLQPSLAQAGVRLSLLNVADVRRLAWLSDEERSSTLVWNITDGAGLFLGSHVPSFARLIGVKSFGNSTYAQTLSQDKFKTLLSIDKLGIPVPRSVLVQGRRLVAGSLAHLRDMTLFVKPCSLDNKIGVFRDSKADNIEEALEVAERINRLYGDRAIIQQYVDGKDLRVSFLNITNASPSDDDVGLYWSSEWNEEEPGYVGYDAHFCHFERWDSGSVNGTPENARNAAARDPVFASTLDRVIADVWRLVHCLGLKDYYALDFRIGADGRAWFMELNTAPFLRNRGMRDFIKSRYGMAFGSGVAAALQNSFANPPPTAPSWL